MSGLNHTGKGDTNTIEIDVTSTAPKKAKTSTHINLTDVDFVEAPKETEKLKCLGKEEMMWLCDYNLEKPDSFCTAHPEKCTPDICHCIIFHEGENDD